MLSKLPEKSKKIVFWLYIIFIPAGGFDTFQEFEYWILSRLWTEKPLDLEKIMKDLNAKHLITRKK